MEVAVYGEITLLLPLDYIKINVRFDYGLLWNCSIISCDYELTAIGDIDIGDARTSADLDYGTVTTTETQLLGCLLHEVIAGAKIINYSLGFDEYYVENPEKIAKTAEATSFYMKFLLKEGYDFVVVQSAGNGVQNYDGFRIGIDAINSGMFASITDDNCYDGLMPNDEILNRIIIVGATEKYDDNVYRQALILSYDYSDSYKGIVTSSMCLRKIDENRLHFLDSERIPADMFFTAEHFIRQ